MSRLLIGSSLLWCLMLLPLVLGDGLTGGSYSLETVVTSGGGALSGGSYAVDAFVTPGGEAYGGAYELRLLPPFPAFEVVTANVTGGVAGAGPTPLEIRCARSGGVLVFNASGVLECTGASPVNVTPVVVDDSWASVRDRPLYGLTVGAWVFIIIIIVIILSLLSVNRRRRGWEQ